MILLIFFFSFDNNSFLLLRRVLYTDKCIVVGFSTNLNTHTSYSSAKDSHQLSLTM